MFKPGYKLTLLLSEEPQIFGPVSWRAYLGARYRIGVTTHPYPRAGPFTVFSSRRAADNYFCKINAPGPSCAGIALLRVEYEPSDEKYLWWFNGHHIIRYPLIECSSHTRLATRFTPLEVLRVVKYRSPEVTEENCCGS